MITLAVLALMILAFRVGVNHWPAMMDWADRRDSAWVLDIAWWIDLVVVAFLAFGVLGSAHAATPVGVQVPVRADGYQKLLEREAVSRFGLAAPVALLAAQLHQESHWRTDARSPYAQGLAQFTPGTADWIPGVCPEIGAPNVWDARWSIRAQACYMRWLRDRIAAATPCDQWAMALSAYNGGLGWLKRDRRLASATGADSAIWFNNVELHTKRAAWAFKENREYPRRILLTLEPVYLAAGWPGRATCEPGVIR